MPVPIPRRPPRRRVRLPFLLATALGLALAAPPPARAHQLHFRHADGAWRLVRGHPGTDAATPVRDAVAVRLWIATPDTLLPLGAVSPDSAVVPDDRLPAAAVGLAAAVDWGVWTKTPDGAVHAPPDAVADPLESWRSRETVLQLLGPRPLPPLLGRGLEIRPLTPPERWRTGHKIRVRVTGDGRPAAGVPVAYDERVRGATGGDGALNIRLRRPGWQVIAASRRRPPDDRGVADLETATLVFPLEVKP